MPGPTGAARGVIEGVEAAEQPAQDAQTARVDDRSTALRLRHGRHILGEQQRLILEHRDGLVGGGALGRVVKRGEPPQDLGVAVDVLARPDRREQAGHPTAPVGAVDAVDPEVELGDRGHLDPVGLAQIRGQRGHAAAGRGARCGCVPGHRAGACVPAPMKPNSRPAIRRSWSSSEPSVMR